MCTSSSQCGNQHVTVVDDKWYHTTTYWKNTPTHIITSATINRRHQIWRSSKINISKDSYACTEESNSPPVKQMRIINMTINTTMIWKVLDDYTPTATATTMLLQRKACTQPSDWQSGHVHKCSECWPSLWSSTSACRKESQLERPARQLG